MKFRTAATSHLGLCRFVTDAYASVASPSFESVYVLWCDGHDMEGRMCFRQICCQRASQK